MADAGHDPDTRDHELSSLRKEREVMLRLQRISHDLSGELE
jgi:hypothetical protein